MNIPQGPTPKLGDPDRTLADLMSARQHAFRAAIELVNPAWRERWCTADLCGCLGCANGAGGLARQGFTKADHAAWLESGGRGGLRATRDWNIGVTYTGPDGYSKITPSAE